MLDWVMQQRHLLDVDMGGINGSGGVGKALKVLAFACAVGLALFLAKIWLRLGRWPTNNNDAWIMTSGKAGVAATVASMTEAVLTGGNDNVVVPVVLWLCVKGLDL